ncbi:MAG: transposase [Verrucomicrobia bacterium]|nr:transposase [Verrucomicrobiota bacterium]
MPRPPASTPPPGESQPPSNPSLRALIRGKRESSYAPDDKARARGFRGWHERGYLPHFDAPHVTQLLTFNLDDAFPVQRRAEWEVFLQPPDGARNSFRESDADSPDLRNKFRAPGTASNSAQSEFRRRLEAWLDRGHGDCWLRREAVAALVEENLLAGHSRDCALQAWVIMPNHVHLIVDVWETPLSRLVKQWKGTTATKVNRLLGRAGHFWQEDYFDTRIRDAKHLAQAIRYVENNPTKAKFVRDPKEWRWSSARRRDAFGRLVV